MMSQFPTSFDEARPMFKYCCIRAEQRHNSNCSIKAQYHRNEDGVQVDKKLGGRGLTLIYLRKTSISFQ